MADTMTMTLDRKSFPVGAAVKLRGDMGSFRMTVETVHNDWYCQCVDALGGKHHVNMAFLEWQYPPESTANEGAK